MAKSILAALRFSRNDVLEITKIFACVIKHAGSGFAVDCKTKACYLQAIEELIYFGYEAVKQHGSHIKTYLKHFHSYIYHSSICFDWYSLTNQKTNKNINKFNAANPIASLSQSLASMFLLAINAFAKLNYPSYYKNFAAALAVMLSGEAVEVAGLNATSAKLAKMFFSDMSEPLQLSAGNNQLSPVTSNKKTDCLISIVKMEAENE